MAFMNSNSRVNPASTTPGLKLTSAHGKTQGIRSPDRPSQQSFALHLQNVIGTTTSSPNGFDCLPVSATVAYCAGSAVVLTSIGDDAETSKRFFRARPNAAAINAYNTSTNLSTPTRGPDYRSRTVASLKDGGFGASSPGSSYQDRTNSPDQRTWTARERIKAATCVSLSADGRFLAVGETGYNPRVLIFSSAQDAPTDVPLSIISEHSYGVRCVAFSSDSNLLATVGHINDGFLYVWTINPRSGSAKLLLSNKCTSYIRGIAWMGSNLITVGTRHVKVWRIDTIAPSPSKQRSNMDGLCLGTPASPVPRTLSGRNCLLGLLADASFTCVARLTEEKAIICSEKGDICLLDDSGRNQKLSRLACVGFGVYCVVIEVDGDDAYARIGGEHEVVHTIPLGDLRTSTTPAEFPSIEISSLPVAQSEISNRVVAIGCTKGHVITIESCHHIKIAVKSDMTGARHRKQIVHEIPAHRDAVMGVRALCQPNQLQSDFYTWSAGGYVLTWDVHGRCKASLKIDLDQQADDTANELGVVRALSQGEYFVSGDKYGVLRVTGSVSRTCTFNMKAHGAEVTDICTNDRRNATTLVTSGGRDRMVQLLQLVADKLELIQTFDDHVGSIGQLLFLQDGQKLLSSSSDRTIVVRELVSRKDAGAVLVAYVPVRTLILKSTPVSMAQPPGDTDTLVVSTVDRQIQKFNLATGHNKQAVRASDQEGNDSVMMDDLVFWNHSRASPQPTLLAGVASTDKTIRLYAYEGLSLLTREHGHTKGVSGVALIEVNAHKSVEHTNAILVSTGIDGTIMIWDVAPRGQTQLVAMDSTDLPIEPTPVKESTAVKSPIRRVLSRSELTNFLRAPNGEGSTVIGPRAANRTPPQLRKRSSRFTLGTQSSTIEALPVPSNRESPISLVPSVPERGRGPQNRPLTPPSPKGGRPRRPTFGARSRTKSAGNVTEFGSINITTEQICRALKAYRKKLSTSTDNLRAENARQLEVELALTVKALGGRARSATAASEAMVGDLLDQHSDRSAQMIDERLAVSVSKQNNNDCPADAAGDKEEPPPAVNLVGEG